MSRTPARVPLPRLPWDHARHQVADPALARFLLDRLSEEVLAATHRQLTGRGPTNEHSLRMLHGLVEDLAHGRLPDDTDLRVLLTVYARHPDYRAEWFRRALGRTA